MEGKSESQSTKEKKQIIQLIVFRVGDEEFGIPISDVQEIIKISTITPIPDSPEFIKGLINVRGDIVAIIDVRARFFLTTQEEPSRHIVITKQEGSFFGLMVDEVMEVLRIQESDIKPPPRLMTKINEYYVHGVVTHDGRLIILLDVAQVLSEEELVRLTEMTRGQHKKSDQVNLHEVEDEKSITENNTEAINVKTKAIHSKKKKNDQSPLDHTGKHHE